MKTQSNRNKLQVVEATIAVDNAAREDVIIQTISDNATANIEASKVESEMMSTLTPLQVRNYKYEKAIRELLGDMYDIKIDKPEHLLQVVGELKVSPEHKLSIKDSVALKDIELADVEYEGYEHQRLQSIVDKYEAKVANMSERDRLINISKKEAAEYLKAAKVIYELQVKKTREAGEYDKEFETALQLVIGGNGNISVQELQAKTWTDRDANKPNVHHKANNARACKWALIAYKTFNK